MHDMHMLFAYLVYLQVSADQVSTFTFMWPIKMTKFNGLQVVVCPFLI